ncbi:MAG: deoxyribodipyrimidine photo-lyase [Pseudomonadota bacterium]|nr:deoxyribodipyrimidine photo-lyase [Pseudomonadota bacterium]
MTRLMWFRTDLRVHDNPALRHSRRDDDAATMAIYFVTEPQWEQHDLGSRRTNLMKQAACELHRSLEELGIPLLIVEKPDFATCTEFLRDIISQYDVRELNFNLEYEINERHRDIELSKWCKEENVAVNKFHDQCIVPPGELKTQNGDSYRVYSPFRKAWLKATKDYIDAPMSAPQSQDMRTLDHALRDYWKEQQWLPEFQQDELWTATEDSGHSQLKDFLDADARLYNDQRDIPELDATSRLSFYLAVGLLSPRQCIHGAWQHNGCLLSGGEAGLDSWINELVWREFYRHLIVAYPELCKHRAFRADYQDIPWRDSESDFQKWCRGETGYPVVDAAMKQLLAQGWMHNRLRMVTAMFLTKHLLIDWRWGEKYFSEQLVDADLASNNGGWQWSASTGADGAPYFRIFNPVTQSERFDKQGHFIARYLPELQSLPAKTRHFPDELSRKRCGYSPAIVEHKAARQRALDTFKSMEN